MNPTTEVTEQTPVYTPEQLRTSSNNMLCTVVYEPLTTKEQNEVDQILKVAN